MELKDQILQTKERKKGFLKAMPDSMRTQIAFYQKLDRLGKRIWIIPVASIVISLCVYLVACLLTASVSPWVLHAILAGLWIVAGVVVAIYLKSICTKGKNAIKSGAQDYVDELNAINARLAGLEKAEKERQEAEKQEARAKARAEAAQREAEAALQRQQAVQASAVETMHAAQPVQPVQVEQPTQSEE